MKTDPFRFKAAALTLLCALPLLACIFSPLPKTGALTPTSEGAALPTGTSPAPSLETTPSLQPANPLSPTGPPPPIITPPLPPLLAIPEPAFPRLGMWWPNTWNEPAANIARYDWVIFGDYDRPRIEEYKAINPNLRALTSTNACELSFDPDPDGDPAANAALADIPAQWFLTQVGSTLTQDVDAAETILHVAEVERQSVDGALELFIPGDAVLIDGESALVQDVDPETRTLTVQRGYIRPASAHPAGARIAAHITFWPGSWLMNVSTLSPKASAPTSPYPEIWAEYNARAAAAMLADPIWDGILLDRSDPNQSWLIGASTARSIDPDQSNTLLSDYRTFDETWNEGLYLYEKNLRRLVGDSRILFANWGMPNYDLLNGNNFEGFPDEQTGAYGRNWQTLVFGPEENGSYFDWMTNSRNPNLTMIETYEDNSSPDSAGDGAYQNPCAEPGFTPNYRKMRFGLTTALLNDGYFSYEINTNGHGSLCLMWFDEYDNAGQGRGYLGMPSGPARRAFDRLATPNLLLGGGLNQQDDLDNWDLGADEENGYAASFSLDKQDKKEGAASAHIAVTQASGIDWRLSFSQGDLKIKKNTDYTLTFWARASAPRQFTAWVEQNREPYETYLYFGALNLTTAWQRFELTAASSASDPAALLQFGLGQSAGDVWLDGISLQEGSLEVWRRDFSGGISLVNASRTPQVIPLGAAFRKIKGLQAPEVNDGSLISEVTLPPLDGIILLKP